MSRYAQLGIKDIASRNDEEPQFQVGGKYYDAENDRVVQYVLFNNGTGNLAAIAGYLAYWHTRTASTFTVTRDVSDSAPNLVAGVFLYAATDAYYTFIQVGGYHSAVETDAGDDIVKGEQVIAHATEDGELERVAAGTAAPYRVVGITTAADVDADDTVAVLLQLDE